MQKLINKIKYILAVKLVTENKKHHFLITAKIIYDLEIILTNYVKKLYPGNYRILLRKNSRRPQ